MSLRSPEVREVAQGLSAIALVRVEQEGALSVRQREQLRRALATAGDALGWTAKAVTTKDPVAAISKDLRKLVKSGAQSMKRDIAKELAGKETEISKLEEVVVSVRELAETEDAAYPVDVVYFHTARDAVRGLVTKTETVTVSDAQEATGAADSVEKSLNRWGTLKDQMIVELEAKQGRLDIVMKNISEFVDFTHGLLREVIATMH